MREKAFEEYLLSDESIKSKLQAVNSRLCKARFIEIEFEIDLDECVSDDDKMYETLIRVKLETNDHNGNNSNALRKYYEFSNGKRFPTLAEYKHTQSEVIL